MGSFHRADDVDHHRHARLDVAGHDFRHGSVGRPDRDRDGESCPSFKIQTRCCLFVGGGVHAGFGAGLGGRGSSEPTRPVEASPFFSSCTGGVKRSAALGTRMAFSTFLTVMSAVAVIPGRRERSELLTLSTVS